MADVEIEMRFNINTPGFISVMILICIVSSLVVAGCVSSSAPAPTPAATTQAPVPTSIETTAVPVTTIPTVNVTGTTAATVFKTYTSSKYGFSIDYPGNWDVNEVDTLESDISLTRHDAVEFYSPTFLRCNTDKSECVNVRAMVKVETDTNPSSTDLDTFFVKDVARITSSNSIEITKRDAMFKLMGDKAYRLDYKQDTTTGSINALSAYTIKNDKAYVITYSAHAPERLEQNNQFEQYYNDVMTMFGSFTITGGAWKTI